MPWYAEGLRPPLWNQAAVWAWCEGPDIVGVVGVAAQPDGNWTVVPWTPAIREGGAADSDRVAARLLDAAQGFCRDRGIGRLMASLRHPIGWDVTTWERWYRTAGFVGRGLRYAMGRRILPTDDAAVGGRWRTVPRPESLASLLRRCCIDSLDPLVRGQGLRFWRQRLQGLGTGRWGTYRRELSESLLDGGRVVGCYVSTERNGRALLCELAVLPEAGGHGWDKLLLQRFLFRARQAGLESAELMVSGDNSPAVELYLGAGFTEQARIASWEWIVGPADDC